MPYRAIIYGQWGVMLVTILFSIAIPNLPISLQLIPLLVSMVLVGLPHGAVDHIVPGWVWRRTITPKEMAVILGLYLIPVGLVFVLWLLNPAIGFVFFIVMTWFHWGLGDLQFMLVSYAQNSLVTNWLRILTAVIRGAFPMFIPYVFFPDDYELAATEIIRLFSPTIPDLSVYFSYDLRLLVFTIFCVALLISLGLTVLNFTKDETELRRTFLIESSLLFVFFALVPPFLAVGIYFCVWHSVRHIARMIALMDGETDNHHVTWQQVITFNKRALPMTAIALIMLVALYFVVPRAQDDTLALVSLYLALIAAVTLPHTIVVFWLDRVQGVWRTSNDLVI